MRKEPVMSSQNIFDCFYLYCCLKSSENFPETARRFEDEAITFPTFSLKGSDTILANQ